MVGLFTFDGPMYKDCNGVYCNTTITNEMLGRYFLVVDKLYLLIRTFTIDLTYEDAHLLKLDCGDNIEIIEMPNLNSPKNFICRGKYNDLIRSIASKADLFFLRIPSILSDMTAKICLELNKPYLVEVGGCSWDAYFNHGLNGRLVAPVMYINQKKTVKRASYATYVTEKWLQKRYPSKAFQISASNVYLTGIDESILQKRILKVSSLSYFPRKIGTIASVDVRYKGQEYIIKSLAKLKLEGYKIDYELVGAGDGTYLKKLAKKYGVGDQIHFLGLKRHDDIWDWLDTIDIYAQPSKQEGLPRALIEAMSRGCICIGSRVAGIPELIKASYVFKPGNVNQICSIIKKIMNINRNTLSNDIVENVNKSLEFKVNILNKKREYIFKLYKESLFSK